MPCRLADLPSSSVSLLSALALPSLVLAQVACSPAGTQESDALLQLIWCPLLKRSKKSSLAIIHDGLAG